MASPTAPATSTLVLLAIAMPTFGAPAESVAATIVPPGNSGASQYVEVVPTARGGKPVGTGAGRTPVLSESQRRRLEAAGPGGHALAAFVQQTGVPKKRSAGASSSGTPAARGPEHLAGVLPARANVTAGGGLGWGLPVTLAAILLVALALALSRRLRPQG